MNRTEQIAQKLRDGWQLPMNAMTTRSATPEGLLPPESTEGYSPRSIRQLEGCRPIGQTAVAPVAKAQAGTVRQQAAAEPADKPTLRKVKAGEIISHGLNQYIARIPNTGTAGKVVCSQCRANYETKAGQPAWYLWTGTFEAGLCPACALKHGLTTTASK